MKFQTSLARLAQTKLTRRQFLQSFGLLVISAVGLKGLIQYLGHSNVTTTGRVKGYGSGPYGGKSNTASSSSEKPTLR